MRRRARRLAISLSAASLLSALPLPAAPAQLQWQAPPGCPSRDYVLTEVARLVAAAPGSRLRARAFVTRDRGDFQVVIELEGAARGVRTLRARSCESLARATALIVALAIDPQAATRVSERLQVPPPQPAPAKDLPAAPAPSSAPPEPRAKVRRGIFAGFIGEHALVPRLAIGAEVGASILWRFARADMAAGVIPQARATLAEHPGVSGDFTLAFLALRACAGSIGEIAALSGCAAMRGSLIWARGSGAAPPSEATARVLSFDPGVLVRVPGALGIGAELGVNLVIPLSRPRFVITEGQAEHELFRPAVIGMMVTLAIHYDF